MTLSDSADGPGIDVHTSEVIFSAEEMEEMMRLAESPPDPDDQPGYSFDGEEEALDDLAALVFRGLSEADKITYLSKANVEVAARALTCVEAPDRERLIGALNNERRRGY